VFVSGRLRLGRGRLREARKRLPRQTKKKKETKGTTTNSERGWNRIERRTTDGTRNIMKNEKKVCKRKKDGKGREGREGKTGIHDKREALRTDGIELRGTERHL
jgi:hypothetical protein